MLAVPVAVGVKFTLQEAALAFTVVKLQLVLSKLPATPVEPKPTVPPGLLETPALEVSFTVAVHGDD